MQALNGKLAQQSSAEEAAEEAQHQADENEYARPKLFAFNICLTIAVIAMLVWDQFPSYFPFMLGVAAALLVNYTPIKMQKKMINRHAGPALMMCSTLMGAAVLMGVLVYGFNADGAAVIAKPGVEMMKTSVVSNMAGIISMILPAAPGTASASGNRYSVRTVSTLLRYRLLLLRNASGYDCNRRILWC